MGGEEVQACLSLSYSLALSSIFSWSLHPAFHKLYTPIYTRLHLNDFNAMCLSSIEKGRESSSLRGAELLWMCAFISMKSCRVLIDGGLGEHFSHRHDFVERRLIHLDLAFFPLHSHDSVVQHLFRSALCWEWRRFCLQYYLLSLMET